jgi:hypothetical protein
VSIAALLQAARDELQQVMTFPGGPSRAKQYVEIQPNGRPPFDCGEWYVGLDELRVESVDQGFLQETFSIVAVVSARTGKFAPDQRGSIYLQHLYGLDTLERQIVVNLHGNQTVRINANANYLNINYAEPAPGVTGDAFQTPLYYVGRTASMYVNAVDWTGSTKANEAFLVRHIPFTGGIRIQSLDIMH